MFGRYEDYNTYASGNKKVAYDYDHVKRLGAGINYSPIKPIIIKAEYSHRFLDKTYNNEPSLNLGITFNGLFDTTTWINKKFKKSQEVDKYQMERINQLSKELKELKKQVKK